MTNEKRQPVMAGNWKMNMNHLEAIGYLNKMAFSLIDADYARTEVAIFPPFTDIRSVQTVIDADHLSIVYGAQDISAHDSGAYTGEISGSMLKKLRVKYALIGHSERRAYHHETDESVNAKVKAAIKNDLVPMIAVGETLDIKQAGNAVEHTLSQVQAALKDVRSNYVGELVIAYEPVWAIGTGEVATPQDAQDMCMAIRQKVAKLYSQDVAEKVRILYGGSVKAGNVKSIMEQPDVDGALIGGAALDPDEFLRIIRWPDQP
jgi:triosephosphate isomerase